MIRGGKERHDFALVLNRFMGFMKCAVTNILKNQACSEQAHRTHETRRDCGLPEPVRPGRAKPKTKMSSSEEVASTVLQAQRQARVLAHRYALQVLIA